MGRIFEFALTLNTMVQGNMAIQAGRVSNSLRQLEIESQRLRREYSQQENELSRINSLLNQNTNRERQLQSMYESGYPGMGSNNIHLGYADVETFKDETI